MKVGTTGYCMGGRLSLVSAAHHPDSIVAAASFHGGHLVTDAPDSPHRLVDRITGRVYVAGAENDASFTADDAAALDDALTAAGVEHTVEFYPGRPRVRRPRQPHVRRGDRRTPLAGARRPLRRDAHRLNEAQPGARRGRVRRRAR